MVSFIRFYFELLNDALKYCNFCMSLQSPLDTWIMALWHCLHCTLEYFDGQFLGHSKLMKLQGGKTSFKDPKGNFSKLYYYNKRLSPELLWIGAVVTLPITLWKHLTTLTDKIFTFFRLWGYSPKLKIALFRTPFFISNPFLTLAPKIV